MQGSIRTFRHVRARVRLRREAHERPAWVVHLAPGAARLSLHQFVVLHPQEEVEVTCYGDGSLAVFAATVVGQAGQDFAVEIRGAIRFEPSHETARLRVEGVEGRLRDALNEAKIVVLDVSRSSFGGLADRPFPFGHRLNAELAIPCGPFRAEVKVANCRAAGDEPGYFRVGLQFVSVSRLDAALWNKNLWERAEKG